MRAGPELPSHAPLRPRHLRVPLVRAREALLLRAVPPGPLQEGLLDLGHRARAHLRHPPLALLLEDDDARLHLGLEVRLLARRRRVELRLALERLAELLADSGDTAAAAEQFEAASEAAMEAGKTKLAMKLSDRAAQLAPEDD